MKDISIKDMCLIVITICAVVLTIANMSVGRYDYRYNEIGHFMVDTKTGDLYIPEKEGDEKEGYKFWWIQTNRIK